MLRSAPLAARNSAMDALDFLSVPGVFSPINSCAHTRSRSGLVHHSTNLFSTRDVSQETCFTFRITERVRARAWVKVRAYRIIKRTNCSRVYPNHNSLILLLFILMLPCQRLACLAVVSVARVCDDAVTHVVECHRPCHTRSGYILVV